MIKNCVVDEYNEGVLPETKEVVNHPDHYNWFGIECIDVVEHFNFNIGNAIKYLWRADKKENYINDLNKAIWYIQREINRIQTGE